MQISSQLTLLTDISEAARPAIAPSKLTPTTSNFSTPPNAIVSFSPQSTIPAVSSPVYSRPVNVQVRTPEQNAPSPVPVPEDNVVNGIVSGEPQEQVGGDQEPASPEVSEQNTVAPEQASPSDDSDETEVGDSDRESSSPSGNGLTEQEQQVVDQLVARDREVRAHEQAHQAVGGQYAGAASYTYQTGPNGIQYAVGGEVPIDVSPVPGDPQATINKMRTVKAAATAPAEPSPADLAVASTAIRILLEAQSELASERQADVESRVGTVNADDVEDSINESAADIFQRFAGNTDENSPQEGLTPSQIDELI